MIHVSDETMVNPDHVIAVSKTDKQFWLKFFCTHGRIITLKFETEAERQTAMMNYKRRT
jgi:hypothetical protein